MKINSIDILLSNESHLEVWKVKDDFCVMYENAEIKDGPFLISVFGIGKSFESACDDYLQKIFNQVLVFHSTDKDLRKEVEMPDLENMSERRAK